MLSIKSLHFATALHRNSYTVVSSMKTYKILVLHDMHMILESLESDLKRALINTKISQVACWKHIEPKTQYIAMA